MTEFSKLLDTLPAWPDGDYSVFGKVDIIPIERIQQITGAYMTRNWLRIPHVTHHDDIDVTDMESRRKKWNTNHPESKLTPTPILAKALAIVLNKLPIFNASISADGASLIIKKSFHIGIAMDTRRGLLVPAIQNVDEKAVTDIAKEISQFSRKAEDKGLSMSDMSGGSMTISSLGHIGGTGFTPIINAPEVAILGLTKIVDRPVRSTDGMLMWKKALPISLSYDHRVINGSDAARFTRCLEEEISNVSLS